MTRMDFIVLLFITVSLLDSSFAKGQVFENKIINSKILQREQNYSIYLPPGYNSPGRDYPVLYLLHGSGDDHLGWVQSGEVEFIANKAIAEGKSTPMIIVMPSAKSGKSSYFNGYKGEWPYEDFFFKELIPFIESNYHVRVGKRYRAIAGLSMGGRSAFAYALKYPEMFSSACPLSPGAGSLNPEKSREFYGPRGFSEASDKEILEYDKSHSILRLIEQLPDSARNSLRWYIDCGDDDGLSIENATVHIALKKKGIPHEFRIRNGNHNWTYWREALPEVLDFISQGFHK